MRLGFFTLLFVGANFAYPQSNLLNPTTLISSVVGVVDSVPSLVKDPIGAVGGVVTVVPAAIGYAVSLKELSDSVNDFSTFISESSDASTILTQGLDRMNDVFDDLIVASYSFVRNVRDNTDENSNLNVLNLGGIVSSLNAVSKAETDLSVAIREKINGQSTGSSSSLDDLVTNIEKTSTAQEGFAVVADNVHGLTSFIFGTAADILLVNHNLEELSQTLFKLSRTINSLSDPIFTNLVRALGNLAQTQADIAEAFDRLNDLEK